MKPLYIKNGAINLHLSAWHCARAAIACWTVGAETNSEERDDWHLLAMLFQAGAQSGYAQEQMSPADEAALEEQLRLTGLEALNRQWERETVEEAPFIQTLLEDSYKRGHQEGRRENALTTLREILKVRFDATWEEVEGWFDRLEAATLQRLAVAASTAETLAAFQRACQNILCLQDAGQLHQGYTGAPKKATANGIDRLAADLTPA